MNVLLLKPPLNKISIVGNSLVEPLELEILAATIPDHDCKILDMRIEDNLKQVLETFQPDLVGVTSYTTEVPMALTLLSKVKHLLPNTFTVVGGCHASFLPEDFHVPSVDAVVIGSGEQTFPDMVDILAQKGDLSEIRNLWIRKEGHFIFTGNGRTLENLDAFPIPNRHLTRKYRRHYYFGSSRPAAAVVTSRGCPFKCSFCSIWRIMEGKYLTRDPKMVASELVELQEKHVFVADDNTLSHARHAEDLYRVISDFGIRKNYKMYGRADAIVKRPDLVEKWRKIGLKTVIMGLESFQDERLAKLNKKSTIKLQNQAIGILKANGLRVRAYFIIDPDFTRKDFMDLMAYIQKQEITEPMFTILTPLPGTDYYDEVRDQLILKHYEFFDLLHAVLPTQLPRNDFYMEISDLYKKSYPVKRAIREIAAPFCTKRLLWGSFSYLKFRYLMHKLRYAYKKEWIMPSESCPTAYRGKYRVRSVSS